MSRSASVDCVGDRVQLGLRPARRGPARRRARRRAGRSPRRRWWSARAGRVDLAGEPGQPLAPVGDGLGRGDQRPLGLGELPFQLLPVLDRLGEPDLVVGERRAQLLLLLADPLRLGVQLLRVAAGTLVVAGGAEVPQPLGGELLRWRGTAPAGRRAGTRCPGRRRAAARPRRAPPPARPSRRLHLGVLGLDLLAALAAARSRRRSPGPAWSRSVARSSASSRSRASRRSAWMPAARRATSACRPSGLSWRRSSAVRSVSRLRLACIASSLRSAFSLRLRCLRTPAASSMKARRSSGLACSTRVELALADDDVHLPADAGVARAAPGCRAAGSESPLISYSLSPERNIRRVIETSVYSIGSAPSVLSMVRVTSARPSGARPAVPAKMTSSILPPRSALAPCSPSTQAMASTTLDLPEPFGPDDAGDPGLQPQRRRGGEGLEALHRQALEMHLLDPRPVAAVPSPAARTW